MAVMEKTIDILGDDAFSEALLARTMLDGQPVDLYDDVITKLRAYALYYMKKVESVNFPNVRSVGKYAFLGCSSLKKVTLEKCTNFDQEAMKGCGQVTEINAPLITSVGAYCFSGTQIEKADFPLLLALSGNGVFANCDKLKTVILPKVTTCATSSFYRCFALEQIDLPSIKSLSNGFLTNCTALRTVNLGPNIKTISEKAFSDTPDGLIINLPISEGTIANAPWGAPNAVIHYDTPYAGNVPMPEN